MLKQGTYTKYGKRALDIILSLIGIILLTPLFVTIYFFIKIDSKGPAIFYQTRVGKNGKKFRIYKFRTMCQNAEDMKKSLQDENEMGKILFKIKNDPRITDVGRILRKSSLDELPQLVNVLKGDMSLVGPRPALPEEVVKYSKEAYKRLKVKPGCSGLWQISGRNNLSFETMIKLDLKYINNINFKNDLLIIFRTIKVMLTTEGAY